MILELILAVVFVEAITEIIVTSEVCRPIREWSWGVSEWLSKLLHCGYCTSVWVAASIAWAIPVGTGNDSLDYILALFVVHRLSNVWHEGVVRWLQRAPFAFHIMKTERVEYEQYEQQDAEGPKSDQGPGPDQDDS